MSLWHRRLAWEHPNSLTLLRFLTSRHGSPASPAVYRRAGCCLLLPRLPGGLPRQQPDHRGKLGAGWERTNGELTTLRQIVVTGGGGGGFGGGGFVGRRLSEGCRSVAEVVAQTPELSSLLSFAPKLSANLQAALQSKSSSATPITLFAPSNAAFAKLMASIPADAKAELDTNTTILTGLLTYHIVAPGAVTAAELRDGQLLQTGLRAVPPLRVNIAGKAVSIEAVGSTATVVQADIKACRAVIHVIDTVLLPMKPEAEVAALRAASRG